MYVGMYVGMPVYMHVYTYVYMYKQALHVAHMFPMPNQDYSCWSDEDLIGKVARLARTVHPALHGLRTLQKCLGGYRRALADAQA